MESQGEITNIFLVSVIFCNLKHQLLHSLRCWNQDVWTVPSSYCSQNSQKTESYFINQSRNPWAAPACWWLRESSQSISFDWPFPYTFFTYFFFGHRQGKDPGLEGCLVSVSLEVLALYGWCTAAHRFYATAPASKRLVTVLPAALVENLLLLCYIQEIPRSLWNCGVLCTADSYWYQSWLY